MLASRVVNVEMQSRKRWLKQIQKVFATLKKGLGSQTHTGNKGANISVISAKVGLKKPQRLQSVSTDDLMLPCNKLEAQNKWRCIDLYYYATKFYEMKRHIQTDSQRGGKVYMGQPCGRDKVLRIQCSGIQATY